MAIRFPSKNDKDKNRRRIGQWIEDQRQAYKDGRLSDEQIEKLELIPGWSWEATSDAPGEAADE